MFWLITTATAAVGGWLVWVTLRDQFRRRFDPAGPRPASTPGKVLQVTGWLLLLAPDAVAALAGHPDGVGSALVWVWRMAVLLTLGAVTLATVLTSPLVTGATLAAVNRVAAAIPSITGLRLRRQGLRDFPRTWEGLLEHDAALSRRLLAYEHDLELAVSYPAMRDYTDPTTRAALSAMFDCDRTRRRSAPALTRDVVTTPYGRSVLAFDLALQAAERNAQRQIADGIDAGERARLVEATSILAYLQSHSTTVGERDAAYAEVVRLLGAPRQAGSTPPSDPTRVDTGHPLDLGAHEAPTAGPRPHPWLSVRQRADLDRLTSR